MAEKSSWMTSVDNNYLKDGKWSHEAEKNCIDEWTDLEGGLMIASKNIILGG